MINCLKYINDIKLFAKKKKGKRSGYSDKNNKNIQPGYENGIRHRKCL